MEKAWDELEFELPTKLDIRDWTDTHVLQAWWYDPKLRVLVIETDIITPREEVAKLFPNTYVSSSEYEDAVYGTFHLEIDIQYPDSEYIARQIDACIRSLGNDIDTAHYYATLVYDEHYEWQFSDPEVYGEVDAITQEQVFKSIIDACQNAWKRLTTRYDNGGISGKSTEIPPYELTFK